MIADVEQNASNQVLDANNGALTTPQSKHIRRRITMQDAQAVADMVSHQLTESEAVLQLGIQPKVWFNWKNKAKRKDKFNDILSRLKGAYIQGNIEQIKKAASGRDGVRHDWRAADRLNSIIAPERFAQNKDASQDVAKAMLLTADTMGKIAEQMMKERQSRSQAVVECPVVEPKQIDVQSVTQIEQKSHNDTQ